MSITVKIFWNTPTSNPTDIFSKEELVSCFENVSLQFNIGVVFGISNKSSYNGYNVAPDFYLILSFTKFYIVTSYKDVNSSNYDAYDAYDDETLEIFDGSSIEVVSSQWKSLVESFGFCSKRYTCIMTNGFNKTIYKFDSLDFLHGLVNGLASTTSYHFVERIVVFDRYQLCYTKFRLQLGISIENVVKEITSVLDLYLISDIVGIIGEYCISISSIVVIDGIRLIDKSEYPMEKYTHYNMNDHWKSKGL